MNVTIFHNPRCSKSRATLALLEERGINAEIRLYLESPPSPEELSSILNRLSLKPRELMRKSETEYSTLGLGNTDLSDVQLIQAMVDNPRLIERPIVIAGSKAAIGRPPHAVLDIL